MASAKSSRSRASEPLGVISSGFQQPSVQESGVQLADKLKIFKTDNFDFDAYVQSKCQTMNEKETRHLCSCLQELKKASAEEMRKSVYANHETFIRLYSHCKANKPMLSRDMEETEERKDQINLHGTNEQY